MSKSNNRAVSTRLKFAELAKARDGLITSGINPQEIKTTSQILRLCVYFTILKCDDPKSMPSQESVDFIKHLWKQTKMTKNIGLDDMLKD